MLHVLSKHDDGFQLDQNWICHQTCQLTRNIGKYKARTKVFWSERCILFCVWLKVLM